MVTIVDVTVIIPTYNRSYVLNATLNSIAKQNTQPNEIILIDASSTFNELDNLSFPGLKSNMIHKKAFELGAAKQRNEGIAIAKCSVIGFLDDDIILEENCIKNLWQGLQNNLNCGGISAIITNQSYHQLGKISKLFYKLMGADTSKSLAGKCIGPAINFLPDIFDNQNNIEVDWLNTGCTFYRKEALPNPVFDEHFTGYSLMEDLALSLRVGKKWRLLNSSKARIFHDSQPSYGKTNVSLNAEMDLVNRFYIMKNILERTSSKDILKLLLQQLFAAITSKQIFNLNYLRGKLIALGKVLNSNSTVK